MSRSVLLLAAIVCVVILTGCGGLGGFDGQSDDGSADHDLLPGLSATEVTDSNLLLDRHYEMEDEGFRTEWERTVTNESGAVVVRKTGTQIVAPGGVPARERIIRRQPNGTTGQEFWLDGGTSVLRLNESGSVRYIPASQRSVQPAPPFPLQDAYEAVDSVTVRSIFDEPAYILEGRADRLGRYENVSFRLRLSAEGHLAAGTFDGEWATGTETPVGTQNPSVELTYSLEPLSAVEAGPTEPPWIEEARTEIGTESDE